MRMHSLKSIAPAALLLIALTGCASTEKKAAESTAAPAPQAASTPAPQAAAPAAPKVRAVTSIDGKKEVAYKCGDKGQHPLNVMYGFQGKDVVVAQVKYQSKLSPNLLLVEDQADQNVFTSNGISWIASKADASNVDKVDGNMLTQAGVTTVNGKQEQVTQIVTKYCKLDAAGTAKLNKATAAAPAKKAKK